MASTTTALDTTIARDPAPPAGAADLAESLLGWYDRHRRVLPWRTLPGEPADPYRVWLSEIMLQQTTVTAVAPYFAAFLERWPSLEALADAALDEVLHAWQGLGYYARARNLHACARLVVERHGGVFPAEEAALRRLPGIGDYSAAAIAAIAYGRRASAVDGNVERVMARLHAVATPLPDGKTLLRRLAERLVPVRRPGDYAQALMDLGATICTPREPRCVLCPWREPCRARAAGNAAALPARRPRPERPLRRGVAFWAERADGRVLLRRRPARGLLGGMMELPSTEWREAPWSEAEARRAAPAAAAWVALPGIVRHGFTHFALELAVLKGRVGDAEAEGIWVAPDRLGEHALPRLTKKIVAHAMRDGC